MAKHLHELETIMRGLEQVSPHMQGIQHRLNECHETVSKSVEAQNKLVEELASKLGGIKEEIEKWREMLDMRLKPLEEYDAKFRPILLEMDMEAQMEAAMAEAGGQAAKGMKQLAAQHQESKPTAVNLFKSMVKNIGEVAASPKSPSLAERAWSSTAMARLQAGRASTRWS